VRRLRHPAGASGVAKIIDPVARYDKDVTSGRSCGDKLAPLRVRVTEALAVGKATYFLWENGFVTSSQCYQRGDTRTSQFGGTGEGDRGEVFCEPWRRSGEG